MYNKKGVDLRSSYIQNNYGPVFENTVKTFLPQRCVELGVLDGYSTLAIARGIRTASILSAHLSHLHAYDLWDGYKYKHGSMKEVQKLLVDERLSEFVTLYKKDAYEVYKDYEQESVCFLHVDISNDGDVLNEIVEQWHTKLSMGGMLLFEGGSAERDEIEWMKKYNKKPIKPVIESHGILNKWYIYATYNAFPSLSVFIRKG